MDRLDSSESGMFVKGAHGERNQRTIIVMRKEIAERNATPTIVHDVNRSVMPWHVGVSW